MKIEPQGESTDPLVQEEVQKANHYWRNEYKSFKKITEINEQPNRFAMNGWSLGKPTIDGTYLRAFEESDTDADGEIYHVIGGSWYKDGEPRVCYGGVWKRTGDLPDSTENSSQNVEAWHPLVCPCRVIIRSESRRGGRATRWNRICFEFVR